MADERYIRPGATIGILGGGQLGRMLSLAASQLGLKTHIFCPDPESCAFDVTPLKTVAAYEDKAALSAFAKACDVVTYEFENVPHETAAYIEDLTLLAPGKRALSIAQDRVAEKKFLSLCGIPIAPWAAVNSPAEVREALKTIGLPAVLKTARFGYDGKGQRTIRSENEAAAAFTALGSQPMVLEKFVDFEMEISVVAARNAQGQIRDFEPSQNVHENHVLRSSTLPADIDRITARQASRAAHQIAGALEYVGVLAVEFFVVAGEDRPTLLVNEIAPRVHNSGHWTQDACLTDQFEQHIRAICGWFLGDPSRTIDVRMENLLGDEVIHVGDRLRPGIQPHIYGKSVVKPGRKMGHLNFRLS